MICHLKSWNEESFNGKKFQYWKRKYFLFAFQIYEWVALRKKCPYSELFWSVLSRIQTEYGGISLYLVWMGENTDQSNSDYGLFLRSLV